MADLTLNTVMYVGLIFAFIIPALGTVAATLPAPVPIGVSNVTIYNFTQQFNQTGAYLRTHFNNTILNLRATLLGSNPNVAGGSFSANPTIFQAFAFIIQGLGTIMLDIVQLPYLNYLSINFIASGMSTILPGIGLSIVLVGVNLLYLYMIFSMLMMGIAVISKYNLRDG